VKVDPFAAVPRTTKEARMLARRQHAVSARRRRYEEFVKRRLAKRLESIVGGGASPMMSFCCRPSGRYAEIFRQNLNQAVQIKVCGTTYYFFRNLRFLRGMGCTSIIEPHLLSESYLKRFGLLREDDSAEEEEDEEDEGETCTTGTATFANYWPPYSVNPSTSDHT